MLVESKENLSKVFHQIAGCLATYTLKECSKSNERQRIHLGRAGRSLVTDLRGLQLPTKSNKASVSSEKAFKDAVLCRHT